MEVAGGEVKVWVAFTDKGVFGEADLRKALAGAEVSFKNKDTGAAGSVLTDESGFYLIPNLAEWRYEIRVKAEGGEPSEPREA